MKHLTLILTLLLNSFALLAQYDIVFDSTFSGDGVALLPFSITNQQGVFLQSDGKIVLMSEKRINFDSAVFTMLRLDADGGLDATYNNTGINNAPTLFGQDPYSIGLLLPSNDLIVAGSGQPTPWYSRSIVLHKYLENGTKDALFGNSGAVTLTEDSLSLYCKDLKIHNDTSVYVLFGGDFFGVDTFIRRNLLYKINTNGSIDSSFAVNGRFEIPPSVLYTVDHMAVSDDGSIYLLGAIYPAVGEDTTKIVKLDPDLTFDHGFKFKLIDGDLYVTEINLDEDGKVIAIASKFGSGFRLWRLMPDGSLDNSFSRDGVFHENLHFDVGGPSRMIEQPDGKLLFALGGGANAMRVNPNGTMDYSFDLDGVSEIVSNTDASFNYVASSGIVLQPDGKMIFITENESDLIKIVRVKARP
ncbi:MAG: hypothetical protein H7246_07615 [Phycisphaerae bacterium]|nr:hypothetical protein [Saprospiraceae bacterium]